MKKVFFEGKVSIIYDFNDTYFFSFDFAIDGDILKFYALRDFENTIRDAFSIESTLGIVALEYKDGYILLLIKSSSSFNFPDFDFTIKCWNKFATEKLENDFKLITKIENEEDLSLFVNETISLLLQMQREEEEEKERIAEEEKEEEEREMDM